MQGIQFCLSIKTIVVCSNKVLNTTTVEEWSPFISIIIIIIWSYHVLISRCGNCTIIKNNWLTLRKQTDDLNLGFYTWWLLKRVINWLSEVWLTPCRLICRITSNYYELSVIMRLEMESTKNRGRILNHPKRLLRKQDFDRATNGP